MRGEIITRSTIWIAILGYTAGTAALAFSRARSKWQSFARLIWTVACLALLAHVAWALYFHHSWSQSSAYRETARQTLEIFGYNWGGGLYINYALMIAWVADIGWWWLRGVSSYRYRPAWLLMAWQGFLVFIIFNATVVFKSGFIRWAGGFICLGLAISWWLVIRNLPDSNRLAVAEE